MVAVMRTMNMKTKLWTATALAVACSVVFGADIITGYLTNITYTNLLQIGSDPDTAWFKIHVLKPNPQGYEWATPTNLEIICTHEPIVVGPTNGQWTIRFK
jgi:hypothetical protein